VIRSLVRHRRYYDSPNPFYSVKARLAAVKAVARGAPESP
jgi:hypothetical protein